MNYDKIILEMYSRIQSLEEQVKSLTEQVNSFPQQSIERPKNHDGVGTKDVREYIERRKEEAKNNGATYLILIAGEIQKELNIKNRIPSVCNAMQQSMMPGDEVLNTSNSGLTTKHTVKYYI